MSIFWTKELVTFVVNFSQVTCSLFLLILVSHARIRPSFLHLSSPLAVLHLIFIENNICEKTKDRISLPQVDKYFTVQPHTLIRQHLDYGHWYDRQKLTPKDIHNTQYVACMNPTAGSFTINPRLQVRALHVT